MVHSKKSMAYVLGEIYFSELHRLLKNRLKKEELSFVNENLLAIQVGLHFESVLPNKVKIVKAECTTRIEAHWYDKLEWKSCRC